MLSKSLHSKGKISSVLQALHIIPLLFFGLVLMLLGSTIFTKALYKEVEKELISVSSTFIQMIDSLYPGDYQLVGDDALLLFKGETDITLKKELVTKLKENTNLDATLYYMDTRILTTIPDKNGKSMIGTGAPATVVQEVLEADTPRFYDKVIILGQSYYTYFTPLHNTDGRVIGMLALGKPTKELDEAVLKTLIPLIVADILLILAVALFTYLYTKKFVAALITIHDFLKEVASGILTTKMPSAVLNRNDELGEIAQSALTMQHSLHTLVERDALTTLYNRRFGDRMLHEMIEKSLQNQIPFCICICDIDFFKKVNDTYGHDAGDCILKNVAYQLKSFMRGNGFAARWGGEEFLLVFENKDLQQSHDILKNLLNHIRETETTYEDKLIKVTMSFGLISGDSDNITALLHAADQNLYKAKTSGRNQIVFSDSSQGSSA